MTGDPPLEARPRYRPIGEDMVFLLIFLLPLAVAWIWNGSFDLLQTAGIGAAFLAVAGFARMNAVAARSARLRLSGTRLVSTEPRHGGGVDVLEADEVLCLEPNYLRGPRRGHVSLVFMRRGHVLLKLWPGFWDDGELRQVMAGVKRANPALDIEPAAAPFFEL